MSFIAENALFFVYFGSAFFILVIAVCWGDDQKINAASLLLASILLTNIFYRLVVIDVLTPQIVNLIFALIDLFLFWVFVRIARRAASYERNYWAAVLAFIQFFMLSVNVFGSGNASFTRSTLFVLTLNGLTIAALATCLISFMPKDWNEAVGVLRVKWLYFKADIFDKLLRVSRKKAVLPMPAGKSKPYSGSIDAQIGARIREARIMRGLKREELAAFLGVTVPQVQKYETGGSRLAASALFAVAKFLETDVRFFYEGVDVELPGGAPQPARVRAKN